MFKLSILLLSAAAVVFVDAKKQPRVVPIPSEQIRTRSLPVYKTGPGVINVHVSPHSHDDVGWLKTVSQYATGSNNSIQHTNVNLEIDTILIALLANPERTFNFVEQAFFQIWLEQASDLSRQQMRQMVASGQMQFTNGGWCMHDEASPSYVDMIDQTSLGHRLITQEFGVGALPRVTAQHDPFGHSSTQANLLSSQLAGFEGVFFGRIDYQDRNLRNNQTSLETIWRASSSTGSSGQTWADAHDGYGPPGFLCFDELACGGNNLVQDDPNVDQYNVDFMVNQTVAFAQQLSLNYRPDNTTGAYHLLFMMGSDFQYVAAQGAYMNMDKLIKYVNLGTETHGVNMFYSTPAEYVDARLAADVTWPIKTDDYMPYCDGPHACWSGYFTSRSALKGYIRDSSSVFQASKQIQFFSGGVADTSKSNPLYKFERAMGVTQHHDGVSGTSKQHVAFDYAKQLAEGRLDADAGNAQYLASLTGFSSGTFSTCDLANATICPSLETPSVGTPVLVLIWNHQGSVQTVNVRIPVGVIAGVNSYTVTGPDGSSIPSQLIQSTAADVSLRVDYYGASNVPVQWLIFQAPSVPAAGYAAVIITPSASNVEPEYTSVTRKMKVKSGLRAGADQTITNGVLTLTICGDTGMLCNYADSSSSVTSPLAQSFFYYNSSIGTDAPKDGTSDNLQPSGAYIFRTNSSTNFPLSTSTPTVTIVTGPIVSEAQIVVAGYVTEVIRLWKGALTADIEMTVGPITNGPAPTGKEIVTRYSTGMKTQGIWKTDSNVRDMILRTRDYRPTWNYTVYEPIAGNYYPVNARITTTDGTNTLSVVVDRSQGGSSMMDGSVELMVQRRLQMDDRRGVGEPINEPGLNAQGTGLIVRLTHRLSISTNADAPAVGKQAIQDMMFKPHLTFSALNVSASQWLAANKPSFTGLSAPLPANIHLLTTHALSFTDVIVRLAHLFEVGEDNNLSSSVTVSLTNMFKLVTLSNCVEMTVPASKILANVPVRTVKIEGEGPSTFPTLPSPPNGAGQTVTINAMDVRTFICNYAPL